MSLDALLTEADRQLTICNACRYCEGFCAVFPALELRRTLDRGDILYLSNLCHDCRDCYSACMYAPPHEFGINVPAVLSEVRLQTYEEYASPRVLGRMVRTPVWGNAMVIIATVIAALVVMIWFTGWSTVTSAHRGPGAFYKIVPYVVMWTLFMAAAGYVVCVWVVGGFRFWRDTASPLRGTVSIQSLITAGRDAATLRYMRGGGVGCEYPGPDGSHVRLILHSFVSYGFIAAFAATILAAIYQDIFGIMPPFPWLSAPVLLGTAGGVAVVIGATGLMWLKARAASEPTSGRMVSLDFAFLVSLDVVALTGILLLLVRGTSVMGSILVIHLAFVLALFLTAPYGKFVHFVYRSLALVQHQVEMREHWE